METSISAGEITLYVTEGSGNSFKPVLLLKQLGLPHVLRFVDVVGGETRAPQFLSINKLGQVPYLICADGSGLAESDAMLWFLAEGSHLVPTSSFERARILQWMFFEQTKLEPNISPARFFSKIVPQRAYQHRADLPRWRKRANDALAILDDHLSGSRFIAKAHGYSIGDIAMFGYVHLAGDAGLDLGQFRSVKRWIERVEATDGYEPIGSLLKPSKNSYWPLAS